MARALGGLRRLRPDGRFVAAFTRVASLARRGKVTPCKAVPEKKGWSLKCGEGEARRQPERPGFDGLMAGLKAWAAARVKLVDKPGAVPKLPEPYPAESAIRGLNVLDGRWLVAPSRRLLAPTASRLAALVFQLTDDLELADAVAADALAVTALAAAFGRARPGRAEALLAEAMGYHEAACRRAKKLGPDDPVRAYLLADDSKLQKLAARPGAPVEPRFLWWRRLVARGRGKEEATFRREHLGAHQLSLSVLGARLALPERPSPAARALPWIALDQALPPYRPGEAHPRAPTGELAEVQRAIHRISRRLTTPSYRLVRGLERLLEIKRDPDPNALFDADLLQRVYLAYAYSGVFHRARYYVDAIASPREARRFLLRFGRVESGVALEAKRWYELYLDASWNRGRAHAVLGALPSFRRLGAPPLWNLYDRAARGLPRADPDRAAARVRLAARLDSRPRHRRWLERAAKTR